MPKRVQAAKTKTSTIYPSSPLVRIKPTPSNTPRVYTTPGGVAVPSVTEVLSVADRRDFNSWRQRVGKKEADRISDGAKVLGTKVHTTAQDVAVTFSRNTNVYVLEEMQPYADAVKEFLEEWVDEVIHTELSLASDRMRFGGTMDLYCRLKDGSLAICDYKTTASITRDHGMQLCAYGLLLREHGYGVQKRLGIRLRKDVPGRWSVREFCKHREDYEGWMGAVALWHWQHGNKLKKAQESSGGG